LNLHPQCINQTSRNKLKLERRLAAIISIARDKAHVRLLYQGEVKRHVWDRARGYISTGMAG
jgi:hypothetical protein